MPKDVELAKNLVSLIKQQDLNEPAEVFFSHDQYNEDEKVDRIQVRVGVEELSRERQARGTRHWMRNATLSLLVLAPQQPNTDPVVDAEQEIDKLLDFVDTIMDIVQQATPLGRNLSEAEAINEQRYDKAKLQDDRQFRAGYLLLYKNIDA